MADAMASSHRIYVNVMESVEVVAVDVAELPGEPEELLEMLAAEAAPLTTWFDVARGESRYLEHLVGSGPQAGRHWGSGVISRKGTGGSASRGGQGRHGGMGAGRHGGVGGPGLTLPSGLRGGST